MLTIEHPSKRNIKEELELLRKKPWFKVTLKYGIAIELDDFKTLNILEQFVSNITHSLCDDQSYEYLFIKALNKDDYDGVFICTDGITALYNTYLNFKKFN